MAGGHLLLMTSTGPLDILGFVGNENRYEDLSTFTKEVEMSVGTFSVLDLKELIRLKRETDRPKDRAVVEILEDVLRREEN